MMKPEDVTVRASPFVFLIRVAVIEFFFALLPFVLVAVFNLRSEYETLVLSQTISYALFMTIVVTSEEIRECLAEPVSSIVDAVKQTLERTPPELAADIIEHGMVLAGGGSLLRGLDLLIEAQTDVPVHLAEDPLTCVAVGTGLYLELLPTLPAGLLATATEASSGYAR